MKNYEKYKTPEEAEQVFYSHCNYARCQYCRFFKNDAKRSCAIQWLYEEAEADPAPQWQKNMMGKFTRKD